MGWETLYMPVVRLRPVVRREPALEPAQRLLAGRESGLPLDERLERLDVLVVGHLEVDGAVVVADVEVQHPERKGKTGGFSSFFHVWQTSLYRGLYTQYVL